MCTRYRTRDTIGGIAKALDAAYHGPEAALQEMFPGRVGVVAGRAAKGGLGLSLMRWGLPPPPGVKSPVVNIRNLESRFWKDALADPGHRCLVPLTAFCEWGADETGRKQPHWFSLPARTLFAFAGLWRPLSSEERAGGDAKHAFAFLTCEPNPLVAAVHPKSMPVILEAADHDRWLDGSLAEVRRLATPYPSQLMVIT